MNHYMKLNSQPFEKIKNGSKDIELRLYDEKRRLLQIGDVITFINFETKEEIKVLVKALHVYSTFKELYSLIDKTRLGYLSNEEANSDDMLKYYSKEQIEKCGVVGIEVLRFCDLSNRVLTDLAICPTCFNKHYENCIYGDNSECILYQDSKIECFLCGKPRADGHIIISSIEHYKDMIEVPNDLCAYFFKFSKKL